MQESLRTILYTWAFRHPASGYVQGINDLVTPFFVVFLTELLNGKFLILFLFFFLILLNIFVVEEDIQECRMDIISNDDLRQVEADSFWCMSKLLDSIQENYTFAQPGIQKMIFRLEELVYKIDC